MAGDLTGADTVIVGAGPAGLGAALALGDKALVLERTAEPGGLARSIELAGAVFDLGGHSFHTPHPEIRRLVFGAVAMEEQPRRAWCHVGGEWIPYPFQKHVAALADPALRAACLAGPATPGDAAAANYDRYLDVRFGAGVARHFMRPYNEKLWGGDLTRLAIDWVGERIPAPRGKDEAFRTDGGKRTPLQADTAVAYPAAGGFGEIFRALARQVPHLDTGETVTGIDPAGRTVATESGRRIGWHRLISTLSLPHLLRLLPAVPAGLQDAVAGLEALPVNFVMVTTAAPLDTPMQRVYCPDPRMIGHKIVLNHNSSTHLRGLPRHGIEVEFSGQRPESDETLTHRAIEELTALGLIAGGSSVAATRVVRVVQGYPVPTHARAAIVARAKAWLGAHGIATVGRFGEWAYINADEALYRGWQLGRAVAAGAAATRLG